MNLLPELELKPEQITLNAVWSMHNGKFQVWITLWTAEGSTSTLVEQLKLPDGYCTPTTTSKFVDDPDKFMEQKSIRMFSLQVETVNGKVVEGQKIWYSLNPKTGVLKLLRQPVGGLE